MLFLKEFNREINSFSHLKMILTPPNHFLPKLTKIAMNSTIVSPLIWEFLFSTKKNPCVIRYFISPNSGFPIEKLIILAL